MFDLGGKRQTLATAEAAFADREPLQFLHVDSAGARCRDRYLASGAGRCSGVCLPAAHVPAVRNDGPFQRGAAGSGTRSQDPLLARHAIPTASGPERPPSSPARPQCGQGLVGIKLVGASLLVHLPLHVAGEHAEGGPRAGASPAHGTHNPTTGPTATIAVADNTHSKRQRAARLPGRVPQRQAVNPPEPKRASLSPATSGRRRSRSSSHTTSRAATYSQTHPRTAPTNVGRHRACSGVHGHFHRLMASACGCG